ncbi:hypothetical protein JOC94_004270 [Bacillus thermophilus]|uniref:Uncharacterized protein n=1 Tax=Siminovitchia thermophila TaxID=1245522 RepID=A0ABS2RCY1_9BACI|nr:hypothetical protein [Siminovitchia thermophila]
MKVVQKTCTQKHQKTMNIYSHVREKDDEKASNVFDDLL